MKTTRETLAPRRAAWQRHPVWQHPRCHHRGRCAWCRGNTRRALAAARGVTKRHRTGVGAGPDRHTPRPV